MKIALPRTALMAALLLALGGCSSERGLNPVVGAVWDRVSGVFGGGTATESSAAAATTTQQNAPGNQPRPALTRALLIELDAAMIRARVGGDPAGQLLYARAHNNGYVTYSSGLEQTITLRTALITATRGISFDLLWVRHDANDPLVNRTRLDNWPERITRSYGFPGTGPAGTQVHVNCLFRVGPVFPIDQVEETYQTHIVQEICSGDGGVSFTNLHMVTPDGQVWRSGQWVGPQLGQVEFDVLMPYTGD